MTMKPVSKQEFFRIVKEHELDVHPHIVSGYPFHHEWRFRYRDLFGKDEPIIDGHGHPTGEKRHFIAEPWFTKFNAKEAPHENP